jgi:sigma54-dependent transcription regulator
VGNSPALLKALHAVDQVAPTDSTVLIYGETGTGKELVARAIHSRSARNGRAMVNVNCSDNLGWSGGKRTLWPYEGCLHGSSGAAHRSLRAR